MQALEGMEKFQRKEIADQQFDRPNFIKPLENVDTVDEGASAHLECHYEPQGDNKLRIEWFVNDKPLQKGGFVLTKDNIIWFYFEITHLQRRDSVWSKISVWQC